MAGLLLSSAERSLLEEYSRASSGLQQKRSHLILLYDDGLLTHQAAEQAGFSRSQARYWKHQFMLDGLAIFSGLAEKSVSVNATTDTKGVISAIEGDVETVRVEGSNLAKEIPWPISINRPGILPGDTLAEAGRKTWLYQFAEMIRHEEPTLIGENIESLHDMRVATRRMRAAVDVFGEAFKPKVIKTHLRGLRATGRALGKVRDMDVLIQKLEGYAATLKEANRGGIQPLIDAWRQERENNRLALNAFLASQEYRRFKSGFNRFVQTPGDGAINISGEHPRADRVCEIVPALIYTRMGAVRAYDDILQNASDAQLHSLRIEFKKLRYAIEYFREILGDESVSVIQDLKMMQDHLGDFHDAVVACDLVTTFLMDWEKSQLERPLAERQNPERIVTYLAFLHAERHRMLITLPEAWQYFNRSEFRSNLAKAIAAL